MKYITLNPPPAATGRNPQTNEKYIIPHKLDGLIFKILEICGENYLLELVNKDENPVRISLVVNDKLFPDRRMVTESYANLMRESQTLDDYLIKQATERFMFSEMLNDPSLFVKDEEIIEEVEVENGEIEQE